MTRKVSPEYGAVVREYAGLAARYDRRWRRYVRASVAATVERLELPTGGRILDVGCGTGVLLEAVRDADERVQLAGTDISAAMLAIARGRLGDGADLSVGNAEQLPFEDASFDAVVSTSVFHFIRQPLAALAEMRRVLGPGGCLVITDWSNDFLMSRLRDAIMARCDRSHFRCYDAAELRALLETASFAVLSVERYRVSPLWGLMTAVARKPAA